MSGTPRRQRLARAHNRVTAGLCVSVLVGFAAGPTAGAMPATAAPASAERALTLDSGRGPSATHTPSPTKPARVSPKAGRIHRAGMAGGSTGNGTDTHGGDGSTADRDLALAATWQIDPELLEPQPGDSAATLDARARLAALADRIQVVSGRYRDARTAAQEAAAAADEARERRQQARAEAVAAHHVYVRDRRLLVQVVTDSYEQPPVTSMQILFTAHDAHDMLVLMGTMQQVGSNQASVVTDAEAAAVKMRESAARARQAAESARIADQKAGDALAAAAEAGQEVLAQVDKARNVLTLAILADQMKTALADAMKYARQLEPGSVAFPLPPSSGFYDNHNWGEHSRHWASFHTGDDYSVACGTPVRAATAGKIQILTDQSWAGPWLVVVSTGQGRLATWYAHMGALAVEPGQRVKPGQVIGAVGAQGNATGCHLHFELHPSGGSIYQDTTDPDPWFKAVGVYPGG